jgi:hypothetical protein
MENEMRALVLQLGHAWVTERNHAMRAGQREIDKTPTEAAYRFDFFCLSAVLGLAYQPILSRRATQVSPLFRRHLSLLSSHLDGRRP